MTIKNKELADFTVSDNFDSSYIYSILAELNLPDFAVKIIIALIYQMGYTAYAQCLVDMQHTIDLICLDDKSINDTVKETIMYTIDHINSLSDEKSVNAFLLEYYKYKKARNDLESQMTQ